MSRCAHEEEDTGVSFTGLPGKRFDQATERFRDLLLLQRLPSARERVLDAKMIESIVDRNIIEYIEKLSVTMQIAQIQSVLGEYPNDIGGIVFDLGGTAVSWRTLDEEWDGVLTAFIQEAEDFDLSTLANKREAALKEEGTPIAALKGEGTPIAVQTTHLAYTPVKGDGKAVVVVSRYAVRAKDKEGKDDITLETVVWYIPLDEDDAFASASATRVFTEYPFRPPVHSDSGVMMFFGHLMKAPNTATSTTLINAYLKPAEPLKRPSSLSAHIDRIAFEACSKPAYADITTIIVVATNMLEREKEGDVVVICMRQEGKCVFTEMHLWRFTTKGDNTTVTVSSIYPTSKAARTQRLSKGTDAIAEFSFVFTNARLFQDPIGRLAYAPSDFTGFTYIARKTQEHAEQAPSIGSFLTENGDMYTYTPKGGTAAVRVGRSEKDGARLQDGALRTRTSDSLVLPVRRRARRVRRVRRGVPLLHRRRDR
jgi:hypothetical protein